MSGRPSVVLEHTQTGHSHLFVIIQDESQHTDCSGACYLMSPEGKCVFSFSVLKRRIILNLVAQIDTDALFTSNQLITQ